MCFLYRECPLEFQTTLFPLSLTLPQYRGEVPSQEGGRWARLVFINCPS